MCYEMKTIKPILASGGTHGHEEIFFLRDFVGRKLNPSCLGFMIILSS